MQRLIVPAPAKLNLFLHVTGRRADGLHTLETLFVALDHGDTVSMSRREDGTIRRTADLPGIAIDDDLAVRAAHALRNATGCRDGVDIAVIKRIPQGGGLGGGSSDAASVLLALNRLWHLNLPRAELMRIGATLGADVPFFVFGEPAFAHGVGEQLPCGFAAAAVGRRRRPARRRADRRNLRERRIDTKHAVGENECLFRGLWLERPATRRNGTFSRGRDCTWRSYASIRRSRG